MTTRTQDSDTADLRIDHQFNQDNSLFARYSFNGVRTLTPGLCPIVDGIDPGCVLANVGGGGAFPGPNETDVHGLQANYLRVFSPTLVAEVRGGYLKLDIASFPPERRDECGIEAGDSGREHPANATGLSAIEVDRLRVPRRSGIPADRVSRHHQTGQRGRDEDLAALTTSRSAAGSSTAGPSKRGDRRLAVRQFHVQFAADQQRRAAWAATPIASLLLGYPSAVSRNFEMVIPNYHTRRAERLRAGRLARHRRG